MKKARKGMLLSLLSLVFALAITATSTYAWFAVNTSVTASNMQVTVKSDTTYLVISKTEANNVDDLGTNISVEATAVTTEVLPVRYREDGAEPASGMSRWETAVGEDYDDADPKNNAYTPVATANIGNYTVHYTFYVGLTSTTALPATNLKVTALTATNDSASNVFLPAVSALVICNNGGNTIDFENVNSNTVKNTDGAILSSTVAKNVVYTIDVYVYINGEYETVTSENATTANLGSFKLSMTLQCTPYGA